MKPIFKDSGVIKFFNILGKLNRMCSVYYTNQDCQKTVFTRRVFKHFHLYWMIEIEEPTGWFKSTGHGYDSEELKIPIIQYVAIMNISYRLGYGEDIDVMYSRAGTHKIKTLKLNYNSIRKLKGKKITKDRYNKLASQFYVKPERDSVKTM